MNESAKEQFKWRFWHLTVILNVIILMIAFIPISLFLFPVPFRVPGAVISILVCILVSVYFKKQYYKTKDWIEKNSS